jgi:hypothetical protein
MSSWILDGSIGFKPAAQPHESMPMSQSRPLRCMLPQSFKNGFTGRRLPIPPTPAFLHLRLHSRYNFVTPWLPRDGQCGSLIWANAVVRRVGNEGGMR